MLINNLGDVQTSLDDLADAKQHLGRAQAIAKRFLPVGHPVIL
jgi:hypothetical protein